MMDGGERDIRRGAAEMDLNSFSKYNLDVLTGWKNTENNILKYDISSDQWTRHSLLSDKNQCPNSSRRTSKPGHAAELSCVRGSYNV